MADEINVTIEATGGVTSHSELNDLDFASAGHTGALPMNGEQINNMASGSASGDAVNLCQLERDYLPLSGGELSGDLLGAVNYGSSGTKVTKVFTEDVESTNLPTIGGASLASGLGLNLAVQTTDFAIPLAIDVTTYKDWKCTTASGDTTLNITGQADGEAGMIEVYNSASGTTTLGTMFTKGVGSMETAVSGDNIVAWYKSGDDVIYSISQIT